MKIIPVEDATNDMFIAQDIYTSSSQRLVTKGTVITESLKRSLIRYNITRIPVEEVKKKREFTKEDLLKAEGELRQNVLERFREAPDDPMMKILFETVLRIEAKEKLGKCQ